ncbi:hypothetical protein O181_081993 [Austropuccinia psidii MF-1]|uniref:Uncharacterized protein n=1 Tax=Austropuccinia psidii MF-1 TaxID=1389203 RepID=A0A9Q3FQW8_9BASI|nr:hypothetical protein [Austropuccinia psidii MF-1]
MSPVQLRNLGIQRNWPEDQQELFRTRRPGAGHLGHNKTYNQSTGRIRIKFSSSTPTPQRLTQTEHGQKEVQARITLGRTGTKLPEDMSQRDTLQRSYHNKQSMESQQEVETPGGEGNQDKGRSSHYPRYRRKIEPDKAYSDSVRITRTRPKQISNGFTPFMQ